jgi:electron transport complex protein RnfE
MTVQEFKDILHNGVWKQNTGVVQLLGMCPILAVSSSVVNGVSLGLATAVVMALSGAVIAPIRQVVPNEARIPVFILIIAVLVTVIQFAMNAYMYSLYVVLGGFSFR